MKHPTQPVYRDEHGVFRFKENKIVSWLVGKVGLSEIALQGFSDEDRAQLAQLIGYSVCGWSDLSYVSGEMWQEAESAMLETLVPLLNHKDG